MAAVARETASLSELEKQFNCITTCNHCQTTLTNPKILPCFHSFCLNCLNEYRSTRRNLLSGTTPNCPTCRTDISSQVKEVAALPTNEFIDSMITASVALSPCRHIIGFRRYTPAKTQRMTFCKTHKKSFDRYCSDCAQIMCQLCIGSRHRYHRVITVDLAVKDFRQMIRNYAIGIESCQAFYRAQNNISETASERGPAAASRNRMDNTPVRPGRRGRLQSGRYEQTLPASPLSSASLETWKECTIRFYEEITTRGLSSDISNISKNLCKLHEIWHHAYAEEDSVRQSENKNSPYAGIYASTRETDKRRELEEKEQCIQKLLLEQREWMATEKRLKDVIKKQREEKRWMEENLREQEIKYLDLKTETDCLAGELRVLKGKSRPKSNNIADKFLGKMKFSAPKISPHKQTRNDPPLHAVDEQNRLLQEIKVRREYYISEKSTWDKKEKQFIENIEQLKSQMYAINKEKEYYATLYRTEKESHESSKRQCLEHLNEKFEWMQEKELCIDSYKEFKSETGKLEGELLEQQKSKANIQKKLTEQLQKSKRLRRELEQLIYWIERIDEHTEEFQTTTECDTDNDVIEKLKASIVDKIKERSEKKRHLLGRNEELNHQMEEMKSRVSSELLAHELKSSDAAEKERACLIREKQNADRIHDLECQIVHLKGQLMQQFESNRTAEKELKSELSSKIAETTDLKQRLRQFLADKKREDARPTSLGLLQELEQLLKWIQRGDGHTLEEQMTNERESENSIIKKIKESIIMTTKKFRDKERQLSKTVKETGNQLDELRMSLANEKTNQQESGLKFERERDKLITQIDSLKNSKTQLNARIQELESEIHHLQDALEHQIESNHAVQEKLKTRSMKNGNETNMKQHLEYSIADNDQLSSTGAELSVEATKLKQQHSNTKIDNRKPTLRLLTGIRNIGNTCYFGSTMQNLVHTVLLTEELQLCLSKQPPFDVELLLTKAYIEFLSRGYEIKCDKTFRHMFKEFCKKSSRFADRGQHDSHDMFVNFLNCLRDEERRRHGSVNSPGFRNVLTAVDKVFGGHTITVYVCSTCRTHYHVCEPFLDISIPLLGPVDGGEDEKEDLFSNHLHNSDTDCQLILYGDERADSVRQAVESTMRPLGDRSRLKTTQRIFQKRSPMPESDGKIPVEQCLVYYSRIERIHKEYLCSPCDAGGRSPMTSALKRTLIYNPPAVLVLHLKRFEQTPHGFKKCNQHITYDEYLDIGPYCSSNCLRITEPNDANVWYSLYGVVVHKGSLTSGHYISYIKVRDCNTKETKHFMQQTFLNRDQVLDDGDIRRINASGGLLTHRKEWKPKKVEGQWYLADDEYIKAVGKTEALSQAAYLLFYERVAKSMDTVI